MTPLVTKFDGGGQGQTCQSDELAIATYIRGKPKPQHVGLLCEGSDGEIGRSDDGLLQEHSGGSALSVQKLEDK